MLAINYFSIYILEIYYTIVWTIRNIKLNKKINNFHERELRTVYGIHYTSFSKFLNIDKSVTIHQRNFQNLVIEIYRVKKSILLAITNEIFQFFENPVYEVRSGVHLPSKTHVQFSLLLNP